MSKVIEKIFLTLSNGIQMPIIGFGTFDGLNANSKDIEAYIKNALDVGYRHIDTAACYSNETEIGNVLNEYFNKKILKREDVFITTKLFCTKAREKDVEPALRESLKLLQLDYVDLFLIHTPGCEDLKTSYPEVKVQDTWKGMETVYKKGLAKSIGVSNFTVEQIERIQQLCDVPIHNLQVELHLHFAQRELQAICKRHKIVLTAYAPLGSPGRTKLNLPNLSNEKWPSGMEPLKNDIVLNMAKKYGKSPAQILLRHLTQKDLVVIPKSANIKRMRENFEIFDFSLSDEDFQQLESAPQAPRLFIENFNYLRGHPEDPFKNERQ